MRRGPRLTLEELGPYLVSAPVPPTSLDWRDIFGNENPIELEVGFGKGLFLVTSAARNPLTNYLGIEIVRKYQLFTATRLAKRGLGNVRVACADAKLFLRDCVRPESFQAIHVFFPDPWWKRRHHKRRLFTEEFVAECQRALKHGGHLNIATDVAEYFEVMKSLLAEQVELTPHAASTPADPSHDLDYLTNYERKFRKVGKPIYRACYQRR